MHQSDIPAALAIASDGWGRLCAQAAQPDFNDMFAQAAWRPFFYVAEVDGHVVGMAAYSSSWLNYGAYTLSWVGVLETHQGHGIGKALVARCLMDLNAVADQVLLVTDIPEFYSKHWDFAVIGPFPTTQGQGDVLMSKRMRATVPERADDGGAVPSLATPGPQIPSVSAARQSVRGGGTASGSPTRSRLRWRRSWPWWRVRAGKPE